MSDPRFARLKNDPRFRRPKQFRNKVVVDDRFKAIFHDEEGKNAKAIKGARIDKYGRTISKSHEKDDLRRFYRLENERETQPTHSPDYARGEVLLESSDEESASGADEEGVVVLGSDLSHPITISHDDAEAEIDLNEDDLADLDAQAATYAKSHPDDDDEVRETSPTHRLAAINLDWDHVWAVHLYKICSSVLSASQLGHDRAKQAYTGKILSVRVYPSEFGKERLAREETEGPPAAIYKKRETQETQDEKNYIYKVDGGEDYDEDALRKYQLERLRYYYAIITCDSAESASYVYSELEGTELERSANVFDLSYVPDDMSFPDEYRDEAFECPKSGYKGLDFVTDALRHSKVKLTWDEDDPERNHVTRRVLSRKEIEEINFQAYLASSSSESESEDADGKKAKKAASKEKLRALLLHGADDELPEGWGKAETDEGKVDMEITFTPGLSASQAEDRDETTLEKYQRKMREGRKRRKEERKQKKNMQRAGDGKQQAIVGDDFFDIGNGEDGGAEPVAGGKDKKQPSTGSRRIMSAEELEPLLASDNAASEPKHFNMKSVLKAEKSKGKRKKKSKRHENEEDNEKQEDFTIDVKDDRFKAIHEDYKFAIDPSNPRFKKTKSMAALLEERSQRQKGSLRDEVGKTGKIQDGDKSDKYLKNLVESVKRKSAVAALPIGKRQKL